MANLGQEFIIKSQNLEDKVNQLLPSQGGFQAGVDLSASTTIIPIVDLTESAEGSSLRQDLQRSLSLNSITAHQIDNATTTMVNTTGYYRVYGYVNNATNGDATLQLTDGTTTKNIVKFFGVTSKTYEIIDITVFLAAGDSLVGISSVSGTTISVCTRQIADINGNLVNP